MAHKIKKQNMKEKEEVLIEGVMFSLLFETRF